MKKFSFLAILAIIAAIFSSCKSDEPQGLKSQQNFTHCYAKIVDSSANHEEYSISTPVTVHLEVMYDLHTCNITISGLKRPDGSMYPTITFEEVSWKVEDNTWGVCNENEPTVKSNLGDALPKISALKFRWNNRELLSATTGEDGLTICDFSFTIDQQYLVYGSRSEFILAGETVSSAEGVDTFISKYPIYTILLKFDTMTADIRITNANFAQAMPMMQMDFPDVPFTFAWGNTIQLEAEALVPTIKGVPYPSFPITKLSGTVKPSEGATMQFNCGVRGVTYNVNVKLGVLDVPEIKH